MSYAGDITPQEAWKLLSENPDAVLVDCRTDAEWRFVGVPDLSPLHRDVVYIEWNRTDGTRNDGFVDDLQAAGVTPGERPVVFLCRSGNRSIGRPRPPPRRASVRPTTSSTGSRATSTRTSTAAAPAGRPSDSRGCSHE